VIFNGLTLLELIAAVVTIAAVVRAVRYTLALRAGSVDRPGHTIGRNDHDGQGRDEP
jgi:hypothetical protein